MKEKNFAGAEGGGIEPQLRGVRFPYFALRTSVLQHIPKMIAPSH